ncbi:uncharacterized protein B0J16DRAFT_395897 [Fusarium flagelliforme]|uniref:uncharacterized protein n=1 Tax=Fusarium flagelliforme TaxID=2675880 RepID=UPI001E8DD17D|nr:uncharacterized protein B0J16DRAFT_395897 [Fusarium flagelliforme]KAH7193891.1 hypothetical protein B0J16DRAFT_395897 [Fusarium flagelliforme]
MDSFTLYDGAVPHVTAVLDVFLHLVDKLEAHAITSKSSTGALIHESLAPDMLPFTVQVFIAVDNATQVVSILNSTQRPAALKIAPGDLKTLEDLRNHVRAAREFVQAANSAATISPGTDVKFTMGPGKEGAAKAHEFVNGFSIPNMYFHIVTAYGILRKSGLELGKDDYLTHFLGRYQS